MIAVKKLNLVKEKLRKIWEDHYSLTVSLQSTQKELDRVKGEFKENCVLSESLREAANARSERGEG